jgi:hypothetical protein
MGFGTGPYGAGFFGLPSPDPVVQTPRTLSTSRKIDGSTKRYVNDANGNPLSMDDTDQRVLLLVAFATIDTPFVTQRDLNTQAANIRAALQPLLAQRPPAIALDDVQVVEDGETNVNRFVSYTNLRTSQSRTIQL